MADLFSIERRTIDVGDAQVCFLEAGSGPALILLHGIGSAASSWTAQMEHFAARYHVIAWDAPGYGDSSPLAPDQPDVSHYAQRLYAFMQAVDIDKAHITGHSLGSLIGARFALLYPRCVLTLTLASCAIGHAALPRDERQRLLQSRLDDIGLLGPGAMAAKRGPRLVTEKASDKLRARVVATMEKVKPRGYSQAAYMLSAGNMIADIRSLTSDVPVHIIFGAEDLITRPAANMCAVAARKDIAFTVIAKAGHAVYLEKAEAFNSALEKFLDQNNE